MNEFPMEKSVSNMAAAKAVQLGRLLDARDLAPCRQAPCRQAYDLTSAIPLSGPSSPHALPPYHSLPAAVPLWSLALLLASCLVQRPEPLMHQWWLFCVLAVCGIGQGWCAEPAVGPFLGNQLPSSKTWRQLKNVTAWATRQGITGPWSLGLIPGSGRGLVAAQDIKEGDIILSMPVETTLFDTRINLPAHVVDEVVTMWRAEPELGTMCVVARYIQTGEEPFGPWLRATVATKDVEGIPVYWAPEQQELLRRVNPALAAEAKSVRERWTDSYHSLSRLAPHLVEGISLDDSLWLRAFIGSRWMMAPAEIQDFADWTHNYRMPMLAPIVDYMNHHNALGEGLEGQRSPTPRVLIRATYNYSKGDQIFLNYQPGWKTSFHNLFLFYGYLPDLESENYLGADFRMLFQVSASDQRWVDIGLNTTRMEALCRWLHASEEELQATKQATRLQRLGLVDTVSFLNEVLAAREVWDQLQAVNSSLDSLQSWVDALPTSSARMQAIRRLHHTQRRLVEYAMVVASRDWAELLQWGGAPPAEFPTAPGLSIPGG